MRTSRGPCSLSGGVGPLGGVKVGVGPGAGPEVWLGWPAHPVGGAVCGEHAPSSCSCHRTSGSWLFGLIVSGS